MVSVSRAAEITSEQSRLNADSYFLVCALPVRSATEKGVVGNGNGWMDTCSNLRLVG